MPAFEYASLEYPVWAVIISAVSAALLGILWYHPKCQGGKWLEARGVTNGTKNGVMGPSFLRVGVSFLLWLLAACFYAFLVTLLDLESLPALISVSCLLWVAFAMPPVVMGSIYTGYPFSAAAIDAAYQLGGYYVLALCFSFLGHYTVEIPAVTLG